MTFAVLRDLHTIIGNAISEIEQVYAEQSGAFGDPSEPSPSPTTPSTPDHHREYILRHLQPFPNEVVARDDDGNVLPHADGDDYTVPIAGLGAPFSPKGFKKSASRHGLGGKDTHILPVKEFDSPPSPMTTAPMTPTTPSPPSSQRLLRTWQSMAALSPSSRAQKQQEDASRRDGANPPSHPPPVPSLPKSFSHIQKPSPSISSTRSSHSTQGTYHPSSYSSPVPSSPSTSSYSWHGTRPNSFAYQPSLDFPSLDSVYDSTSLAEMLNSSHPTVVNAISRIVAASGQLAATVQSPFLTICDAVMQYHLPACMRLFEAAHVPEILGEAGPDGLHVDKIAKRSKVDPGKLAHVLRLLATHHIVREVQPDVFALNRISSLVDTGKPPSWLLGENGNDSPSHTDFTRPSSKRHIDGQIEALEKKYEDTNGIAAFVGLCTDELFKSAAYMTEAWYLSERTKFSREPTHAPFNFAFDTLTGFFAWLEGEDSRVVLSGRNFGAELGPGTKMATMVMNGKDVVSSRKSSFKQPITSAGHVNDSLIHGANRFRLERFGKAMTGTASWEAPYAILQGFDWASLPYGSTIVDVGGGIGSTSMLLANAFTRGEDGIDLGFEFVIQDRPVVVEMGEKAWRSQCQELLDNGTARFQVHDFFTPQPIKHPAIFLLRVVLHDWSDYYARKILLGLREAANEDTRLIIADFVLPMACVDNFKIPDLEDDSPIDTTGTPRRRRIPKDKSEEGGGDYAFEGVEGVHRLAPAPLLANLGKASANAYWMDLTMQVTFNSQERTLREIDALTRSAGWRVIKVTHAPGSLFGHIVAVPVPIPATGALDDFTSTNDNTAPTNHASRSVENHHEVASRCGTPTFGSRMVLPSRDLLRRGTGKFIKPRGVSSTSVAFGRCIPRASTNVITSMHATAPSSNAPVTPKAAKKRPSPLAIPISPSSHRGPSSPRVPASPSISRRASSTSLHKHARSQSRISPIPAVPALPKQIPPSVPRPRSATIGTRLPVSASRPHTLSPSARLPPPPLPNIPSSLMGQVAKPASSSQNVPRAMTRRTSYFSLRQDASLNLADHGSVSGSGREMTHEFLRSIDARQPTSEEYLMHGSSRFRKHPATPRSTSDGS